jgi:RNase P protein component
VRGRWRPQIERPYPSVANDSVARGPRVGASILKHLDPDSIRRNRFERNSREVTVARPNLVRNVDNGFNVAR